ncbi:MAG: hypothetical protein Q4P05_08315 [Actinomycetaceae bacterium]|nr:hypothetical protein [Actinomycetaceae bacterium]
MPKKPSEEPSKLESAIIIVAILVVLPLPGALFYAGTEWLIDPAGVPKEFIITYFGQMLILLGWGLWARFKHWD